VSDAPHNTDKGPPTEYRLGWGREVVDLERAKAFASVGKGWQPIIDYLFDKFEFYCTKVHITQVKEKYGGLRFYYAQIELRENEHYVQYDFDTVIQMAEGISYYICQQCGRPGKVRRDGWHLTLCDECAIAEGRSIEEEEEPHDV
jgi:hypothetical protein